MKYLFKYIYKGSDKAQTTINNPISNEPKDEITEHINNRYVSTIEACWHFFSFGMNVQDPPVVRLELHLEDEQNIMFSDQDSLERITENVKKTKLTAWFELNKIDKDTRKHIYHDIPKYYVWKAKERIWQKRKFNKVSRMIGRLYFISPNDSERFSMRILLLNTPGATSFEMLRTADGICYDSYQKAAIERGLLADDKIWSETMLEACSIILDANKIRSLFAMILAMANPSNPVELWEKFKIDLAHDFIIKERSRLGNEYIQWNQNIQNLTIYHLNIELESYNTTTKKFYGLPIIPVDFNPGSALDNPAYVNNQHIRDHLAYDRDKLKTFAEDCKKKFNKGQLETYETIMKENNKDNMFFIDGPGKYI